MSAGGDRDAPLFTVIILNWNGAACLPRCLEALSRQTCTDFELLLLDNASTDGSADQIETGQLNAQVVHFERNLEFSAGNNRGAALARGRWLAFLNNDAFPEPNWLESLAQAIADNPGDCFFASRLVYAGKPGVIQAAGDAVHVSGSAWPLHNGGDTAQAARHPAEVFSASAAAAVYPADAFRRLGGFCEAFVSHLEDVDLGFRLRLLGYRCRYIPEAVVAHVGSASYGFESERTVYQVQRNLVWLYMGDMPGRLFWKYLPAHLAANLFFWAYYSLRGRAKAVWRAKWDALRGLPAALRRRKHIQESRQASLADIDRALDHGWASPYLLGRKGSRLKRILGKAASASGTRS